MADPKANFILNVHSPVHCRGFPCVIHNPSLHHMRGMPITWQNDTRRMVRRCPHGVVHPDPDHLFAIRLLFGDAAAADQGIHACCTGRCCLTPIGY